MVMLQTKLFRYVVVQNKWILVIIIFIIIYVNDNESLKSIVFIAETCAIHTEW